MSSTGWCVPGLAAVLADSLHGDYFATVLQGLSQRAQDGATATQLIAVAELALAAWSVAPS